MDFSKRYGNLNEAQKQAVDTTEGPVMVIAGPGTGKTELLSIRAANILQKTDVLPENILCLTFTESGASAMRDRLVGIIGKDAYKVAIHTFHSFGSEIINQYGEYFYHGANFRPADDLSRYELIKKIFDELGHDNILNKKMNNEYTYLRESLTIISEIKKSGLTSDELLAILDANDSVIEKTEQLLTPIFDSKISKSTAEQLATHIDQIRDSSVAISLPAIASIGDILSDSLQQAVDESSSTNSTKPVTAWRNNWFKKNENGKFILKSKERQIKLRSLSSIYEQYLSRMSEAELYDFDDMILRVVHAIEIFDDLRFNLQEKYQYIMVDEFQDTNMAQMRILHNLTNNEAHGDTPNILVVGDDDQAIYSFQGADISNILDFKTNYPKAKIITLTDNYRSKKELLEQTRKVITQGFDRLENRLKIDKNLTAKSLGLGEANLLEAQTEIDEKLTLIENIKKQHDSGIKLNDIAVLTRKHSEIESLLPYFTQAGIPVQYERRDNVLDMPVITFLENLSRTVINIFISNHHQANVHLSELLAHPAWGIDPKELWQLSLKSYTNKSFWLEEMQHFDNLKPIKDWLISTAFQVPHTNLEQMLDILIGKQTEDGGDSFVSPIYEYFFSEHKLKENPGEYIYYLQALRVIRTKLREYYPGASPNIISFIEFIDLHRLIGSGINSIRNNLSENDAVNIMTAHKSKGLEFDSVYIVNAIDSVWGEKARTKNRIISYPENLPLSPVGDSADERLRLFYVAATRAKSSLTVSYSKENLQAKTNSIASFLIDTTLEKVEIKSHKNPEQLIINEEIAWYERIVNSSEDNLKSILKHELEKYQLSVTHLTNFLDVTRGGPQNFLLQNMLHFPQAMSPASAYGSAIHSALQQAHLHLAVSGKKQAIEDILHNFEIQLKDKNLPTEDYEKYLQKGYDDLQVFLDNNYSTFKKSQKTELNFKYQNSLVGDAKLTGALDLVDIDSDKMMTVTDYKTGKPAQSWAGKTDYEKIKLHKYKQQLMFYKILVENSRDYRGHTVEAGIIQFIEPTVDKKTSTPLSIDFNKQELEDFKNLIEATWKKIINLDLPDTSKYSQNLKGILEFEKNLIEGTI